MSIWIFLIELICKCNFDVVTDFTTKLSVTITDSEKMDLREALNIRVQNISILIYFSVLRMKSYPCGESKFANTIFTFWPDIRLLWYFRIEIGSFSCHSQRRTLPATGIMTFRNILLYPYLIIILSQILLLQCIHSWFIDLLSLRWLTSNLSLTIIITF